MHIHAGLAWLSTCVVYLEGNYAHAALQQQRMVNPEVTSSIGFTVMVVAVVVTELQQKLLRDQRTTLWCVGLGVFRWDASRHDGMHSVVCLLASLL